MARFLAAVVFVCVICSSARADTVTVACFGGFSFGGFSLPVCPGAPQSRGDPGRTFTINESGGEVSAFHFGGPPFHPGDLVLCESGTPCSRSTPRSNWSDLIRFEGENVRFLSDGPGVDFNRLGAISGNALFVTEPRFDAVGGETIIYQAISLFSVLPSPVFRTNT